MGTVLVFQNERPVFLREQANQLYDIKPYFATKNILELPVSLLVPLIILLLPYWSCGFVHSPEIFFKMYLVMVLVGQCGIGLGLLISAATSNATTAISFIPIVVNVMTIFSGLFANSDIMPSYISWAQWLSCLRYANEAAITILLKDVSMYTERALELEGFTMGYEKCVIILAGFAIVYRIAAFIALRLNVKKFQ